MRALSKYSDWAVTYRARTAGNNAVGWPTEDSPRHAANDRARVPEQPSMVVVWCGLCASRPVSCFLSFSCKFNLRQFSPWLPQCSSKSSGHQSHGPSIKQDTDNSLQAHQALNLYFHHVLRVMHVVSGTRRAASEIGGAAGPPWLEIPRPPFSTLVFFLGQSSSFLTLLQDGCWALCRVSCKGSRFALSGKRGMKRATWRPRRGRAAVLTC